MSECRKSPEGKAGECCPRSTAAILAAECCCGGGRRFRFARARARNRRRKSPGIAWAPGRRLGRRLGARGFQRGRQRHRAGEFRVRYCARMSRWRSSPPSTLTPQELAIICWRGRAMNRRTSMEMARLTSRMWCAACDRALRNGRQFKTHDISLLGGASMRRNALLAFAASGFWRPALPPRPLREFCTMKAA
jgi:hypothetical protein